MKIKWSWINKLNSFSFKRLDFIQGQGLKVKHTKDYKDSTGSGLQVTFLIFQGLDDIRSVEVNDWTLHFSQNG